MRRTKFFAVFLVALATVPAIEMPAWAQSRPAAPAEDDGAIVFASDRDGDFEIYRMNSNGEDVVQLTQNAASDTAPSASPDGTRIAFLSDRDDGGRAVYVMKADGTNPTRLADDPAESARPTWSPDGKRIAFDRKVGRKLSIVVIDSDGQDEKQLIDDAMMPAWSPDGTTMLLNRGQLPALYSMNVDGTNLQPFLKQNPNGPLPDLSAIWSPDGRFVAYTAVQGVVKDEAGKEQMSYEIRIVNADGSEDQPVCKVYGLAVCWTGDGARIVYSAGTRESMDLFIVNRDGTGAKQLTSDPGKEQWATWLRTPKQDAKGPADGRAPAPQRRQVTLAFDQLDLDDLAPFLSQQSSKRITISPQFRSPEARPRYTFTLKSPEVISIDEAYKRVMEKLRADGLEIREDQHTIEIRPGNYLNVWKPE